MWARACIRAMVKAMDWLAPMGRPNASRSLAYFTLSSTQPWATPVASAAIAMRPSSRMRRNPA